MFDETEFEARRWLRWAVDRAHGWALSDAELLTRLNVGLAGREREETLREIERRIVIWDAGRLGELCSVLSALERRHRGHQAAPRRARTVYCSASYIGSRRRGRSPKRVSSPNGGYKKQVNACESRP